MLDFTIRPVRIEDAAAVNEIRRMDGVRENILGIISERLTRSEDFIKGLSENDHLLVAEVEGKGIGTALFKKVIDLADNWLMLTRLELTVFVENDRAVKLYKSLGFQIEGTRKYGAIRNGQYADEYLMARYNLR